MRISFVTLLISISCALTISMTGCVSTNSGKSASNSNQKQQKHAKKDVVCHREAPTGSHIPQLVCYRKTHVKDRRNSDREKVRGLQLGGALNPSQPSN